MKTGICWRHMLLAGVMLLMAGCQLAPPPGVIPVQGFMLDRYLGRWYEIARLDHRFERGLSRVTATYVREGDGLKVINRGYDAAAGRWREATGRASFLGAEDVASLKVSFFGPFYGGYHVFALGPDYRWALVMGPSPDYFWILSREPAMPEPLYASLLATARQAGVDTSLLQRVQP